jgi:phosphopantetheine--protein transferase-like protein
MLSSPSKIKNLSFSATWNGLRPKVDSGTTCIVSTTIPASAMPSRAMQAKLHDFELARAARLRVSEDRNSYMVAHYLLPCSVQVLTNSVTPSWTFAPDADGGKPRLLIESQTLHASLSHTRGAVAVAISRVADIGVDVEAIAPIDELDQVAERVLTHREQRAVSASDHPIETFIQLWTRKEALAKAFGLGLRAPFSSIDVLDRTAPRLPSELSGPIALSDASCSGPHRLSVALRRNEIDPAFLEIPFDLLAAQAESE